MSDTMAWPEGYEDDGRYESCPDCTCCTNAGCHPGRDSECPYSERMGDFVCPCTSE